jgi:hypothetical protein
LTLTSPPSGFVSYMPVTLLRSPANFSRHVWTKRTSYLLKLYRILGDLVTSLRELLSIPKIWQSPRTYTWLYYISNRKMRIRLYG